MPGRGVRGAASFARLRGFAGDVDSRNDSHCRCSHGDPVVEFLCAILAMLK
jgi:hypothetical protein